MLVGIGFGFGFNSPHLQLALNFKKTKASKSYTRLKEHPHPTLHFGKFLFFEKEDSSALSSGRVCISSKSHVLISENVQVEINNELFEATVQEIGSWCIKITDDYIDLSSNDNIKDVDTSSESIDDHSVDDLEYIQTNLNNIVNQVSEQKMDNNEENKQGEEDIHLIVPQQPPKEEANNKESNPECKAESSDLSRPPGFEFMKKSSSPSSKCSTSFARFRKKDIKGVSLIHELNQIIDVGNSLGYDVRVVERGKEENACGSKIFALNTIMARGRSGGLISMWDPNFFSKESIWCDDSFIIIKGNWKNVVGDCYMVNIYGPQDQVSKLALWNRLQDFMHHHNGSYIMFGDMNAVRNEQERVGSIFNNIEADYFNSFIDATGLVDLPIGGRCFTWMNKAGTKLSKLDRFLISEDVIDLLPDIRITALDRIWSDHNPILLHVDKIDFGPSPFKLYNSWLLRDGFDDLIKSEWDSLDSNNSGFPIKCHEKLFLKAKIPNSFFFTLIPKVNYPTLITYFRLISLIGIHYKIIAKILANRLSKVIDKIVSKEQSAFIAGLSDLDLNGVLVSKPAFHLQEPLFLSMVSLRLNSLSIVALDKEIPYLLFLFILVMEGLHNAFTDAGDDVIITTGWNARDLENIIRVFHVFYLAFGLNINIHKSNIYGIGGNEDEVYNMASNAGCIADNIPFNYLGLPIGSNMKSIASWKMLIDPFRSRLSTWKSSLLSIGGRLTLIKLFTSPNDLWVKVVKSFHGHEGGFDNNGCSFKGTWANIVGSSNFLHLKGIILNNSFRFNAGCGTRIRFWKDIWVGEAPFSIRSATEYWCSKSCFFRDMLNEIGQINIVASEDTCVWNLGPNGIFTVKDARNIIDQKTLPSLPYTSWDKIIIRKVNIFMWRLSLDRLPHRLNLSLRGMDISAISCSSCNANVESANHIFFECIIASDL
ncbi:RNA-directed DNA polymerase, eukaryota, reverse transcriptase zinc-binding domain protein [Tanacetum coccineum]|uniref:RNA-directed DNA polymerase, eukaryota, reverse transcriptase zinc-binding domain protein n=1 Tax=Tanacetum coccineum TaxID=301880 RepID=A0ABQ5IB57_9ASTR